MKHLNAGTIWLVCLSLVVWTGGCGDGNEGDDVGGADAAPAPDAGPPSLSVDDLSITEGDDAKATTPGSVTVTLSTPLPEDLDLTWATVAGTAMGDVDFVAVATGTASIPAGQTTATLMVEVLGDLTYEGNEAFEVVITDGGDTPIVDGAATVTVDEDEAVPALGISDVMVAEAVPSGLASFTVSLSGPSATAVTVEYAVVPGTAGAADVMLPTGTLSIPPGESLVQVDIPVIADALDEDDESFQVTLAAPIGGVVADPSGLGTILDDDALPHATAEDVVIAEGDGTTTVAVLLALDAVSGRAIQIAYATADQTALAGVDYQGASGTVTIPAGDTSAILSLVVNGDTTPEATEAFRVDLEAPVNVVLDDLSASVTISNDELATVTIGDQSVTEGHAGTTALVFQLTSTGADNQVVVTYNLTASTATPGVDFVATSGQVSFDPGETSETVTVTVNGDLRDEFDETFSVDLGSGQATLPDPSAIGTIVDDDLPPSVSIGDSTVTEGDTGPGAVTFQLTLSAPSGKSILVPWTRTLGTASANDFTGGVGGSVAIPAGATTAQMTTPIANDTADDEDTETFTITLSSPTNATLGDATGAGSILDNDPLPQLSLGDASLAEGAVGATVCAVALTLSAASNRVVQYTATTSGTATVGTSAAPGVDLVASAGPFLVPLGNSMRLHGGTCVGDTAFEANETVVFNLGSVTNGTIADGTGTFTILNDDPQP